VTSHSNSIKRGKLKRRLTFKPLICAAIGCRNRFVPIREGHLYCSDTCSAYMRNRAKRERDRLKKEKINSPEAQLGRMHPDEVASRAREIMQDELRK
jgi:hypothetical protein